MERDLKELVETYIQTNSVKLVQKTQEATKQPKTIKKAEKKVSEPKAEESKPEREVTENSPKETSEKTTPKVWIRRDHYIIGAGY